MNYGLREVTLQKVATSGTSAASSAFGANIEYARIVSDTDCWITFATSPTSTTSKTFLPAKEIEIWKVSPGQKVAAILASGTGALYISELSE
tara:strand:- start:380 stop:655 length:276 start_codon:yes stop_codon:yes gene_type:complete